jgi:uncharacterized protein (TIGR02594 family)
MGGYPWMQFALDEFGESEIAGSMDNPRILQYLATVGLTRTHDETPWCSAFVNWCMSQAGIQGTGSGRARSWLTWGDATLGTPSFGAITVLWRGSINGTAGHVAFYVGSSWGDLLLLGGNQGDSVSVSSYPASRLLGYRWPPGYTPPAGD